MIKLSTSQRPMEVLVSIRRAAKLSQGDMARRLQVPQSRVSRIENSQGTSAAELVAYADALGLVVCIDHKIAEQVTA